MSSDAGDKPLQHREGDMSDSDDTPSPQMSYHNNEVTFKAHQEEKPQYAMVSCKFTIVDYSITSGQDPKNKIAAGQVRTWFGDSEGRFSFEVGRSGSSTVANFWKNRWNTDESTFDHHPGNLNFAFRGTLDMDVREGGESGTRKTYRISNFGLAQGKAGTTNNWWVGCKGGYQKSGYKITCKGVSSSGGNPLYFTFRRGGNNNEVVDITNINPNQTF